MVGSTSSVLGSPHSLAVELAPALEESILNLTIEAYEHWVSKGFPRSGDTENEFTAVIVGCMREIARSRNLSFVPRLEQGEYTEEVYAGKVSPKSTPRIDIAVTWSFPDPDAYYTIECKRIDTGHKAKLYVTEGMLRFVRGKYASSKSSAAMLGYVIKGSPEEIRERVNLRMISDGGLALPDRLVEAPPIKGCATVYRSRHRRTSDGSEFRIAHMFVDVRHRTPLTES